MTQAPFTGQWPAALREKGIEPGDSDDNLKAVLAYAQVNFADGKVFLNRKDVSEEIRTTEMGHYSSVFSAREGCRDFLLDIQRNAALNNNIIAEGRDMTTVVFPDAWKKFYLDASLDERAKRRYLQLKEKGADITEHEAERMLLKETSETPAGILPLSGRLMTLFI